MTTKIEVADAVVQLPSIVSEIELIFRDSNLSEDKLNRLYVLCSRLHLKAGIINSWAMGNKD